MQKAGPLVVLSAVSLLLSLPILLHGFPIQGHDARQHLLWCVLFSSQFWAGEAYPRWLTGLFHGFGGPTFFVYGPLPYFAAAFITPIARWFPGRPPGFVELSGSAMLALWGSGLCAYLWLRRVSTETAALAGAVVYMLSPYHLVVDLYMRAAVPEFWSFVWMPLILYFTDRLLHRERYALPGLAVSFALLITTHLFTTLMFAPIPAAYALFCSKRGERIAGMARMAAGLLLGAGLAAIYLAPAIDHEKFISSAKFRLEPLFHWDRNFLPLDAAFLHMGLWPTFEQFLALLAILFAIALLCFAIVAPDPFWLVIGGASLLMTLPISAPVWKMVPLLEDLQFPWRYQTVLSVAVAALSAQAFQRIAARLSLLRGVTAAVLCLIGLAWIAFYGRQAYVVALGDHVTGWTLDTTTDQLLRVWARPGTVGALSEQVQFEGGAGTVDVEKWAPRDIRVKVNCERESRLLFHQFYYPGWSAGAGLPVDASPQGLVRVTAPAGAYELRLRLDGGRMETAGWWVTAMTFLGLLCMALLEQRLPPAS